MLATSLLLKGSVAAVTAAAAGAVGLAHASAPANPTPTSSAHAVVTRHAVAVKLRTVLRRLEHGEFTVARNGGTATYDVQRGHVTSIDATSVAVTSADGFKGDYTVTTNTRIRVDKQRSDASAVHVGDRIAVLGTGGNALLVIDRQAPADTGPAQNNAASRLTG